MERPVGEDPTRFRYQIRCHRLWYEGRPEVRSYLLGCVSASLTERACFYGTIVCVR